MFNNNHSVYNPNGINTFVKRKCIIILLIIKKMSNLCNPE